MITTTSEAHPTKARYGGTLYCVEQVTGKGMQYLTADSVSVQGGALMLYTEVNKEEDSDEIELLACAVFAPGQWLTAYAVTWDDHEILFSEEARKRIIEETEEDEEG